MKSCKLTNLILDSLFGSDSSSRKSSCNTELQESIIDEGKDDDDPDFLSNIRKSFYYPSKKS